jgi:hypothetical protein
MATVIKQAHVDAPVEEVWAAIRDVGALHDRLAPGFVVATELDGDRRRVTFFNGRQVTERVVGVDEDTRRLAYSVIEGFEGCQHHNASTQVFDDGAGGCELVWIADVLPDEVAGRADYMMGRGLDAIRSHLGRSSAPTGG